MPVDVEQVRQRLAAEREQTRSQLEALTTEVERIVDAARDVATDDEHDPEGSTIAYERARTGALVDQAKAHLVSVDAAVAQLEAGTYGRCVICGGEISAERLEARAVATTCIACASRRR
ncbi:MAG TPA: TraR/DksA C4-type zinc finger protein [Mycobacteriales bacterium]|nr:TraR/DksA C4-type zinc finger protein [Mycobacteriales bacterium]